MRKTRKFILLVIFIILTFRGFSGDYTQEQIWVTGDVIRTQESNVDYQGIIAVINNLTDENFSLTIAIPYSYLDIEDSLINRDFSTSLSLDMSKIDFTMALLTNFSFEGSTEDSAETKLKIINPTQDNTVTFPNNTGTVLTDTNTQDVTISGGTPLVLEGEVEDAYEFSIIVEDPTSDTEITFPNETGTILTNTGIQNQVLAGQKPICLDGDTEDIYKTFFKISTLTADRVYTFSDRGGFIDIIREEGILSWINMNGVGEFTVNDSYKVLSTTDNGVGDYQFDIDGGGSDNWLIITGSVKDTYSYAYSHTYGNDVNITTHNRSRVAVDSEVNIIVYDSTEP